MFGVHTEVKPEAKSIANERRPTQTAAAKREREAENEETFVEKSQHIIDFRIDFIQLLIEGYIADRGIRSIAILDSRNK